MYKEHKAFKTPEDEKKIWRYLDFIKFFDLISTNTLFFPSADKLGDPFEGSYPKAWKEYFNANIDKIFIPETWDIIDRNSAPKDFSRARRLQRKFVAISCWNMQEEESAALWNIYTSTIGGIALQTTVANLKKSIINEKRDIHIGEVEYIDYNSELLSDTFTGDYILKIFLYKGKSYSFEHEVRMVVKLPVIKKIDQFHAKFISNHKGYNVKIDPNILIEKIYISPTSDKWHKKVVETLLEKYELKKVVHQSILKRTPVF